MLCKANQHFDQNSVIRVAVQIANKFPINLDHVKAKTPEIGKGGLARAEIIDCKCTAKFAVAGQKIDCAVGVAHGAALGLAFYTGAMFPPEYKNRLFIVQHGSWDRAQKVGYQILALEVLPDGKVVNETIFASGWKQGEEVLGRPSDVLVMPDGALLVADDRANVIYRISYTK